MKVIQTSNYDLDNFKETLVSDEGLTKEVALEKVEELNRELTCNSSIWYKAVNDFYILCDGDPNT